MLKVFILFGLVTTALAGFSSANNGYNNDKNGYNNDKNGYNNGNNGYNNGKSGYNGWNNEGEDPKIFAWWDMDNYNQAAQHTTKPVPFPQCLQSGSNSQYLKPSYLQNAFDKALNTEEYDEQNEHSENVYKQNYDVMDDDTNYYSKNKSNSKAIATAAMKLTKTIMTKLACNLNGTDPANLNSFLQNLALPQQFCSFHDTPSCDGKLQYRTPTGLCNNLLHPYQGNAHTAFGRLKPAAYDDHLSEPRRKSVKGGLLPPCRKLSLAFGTKPVFDRSYNNFFVSFGQYIAHDIALSVPVSDTYSTPITTCTCDSKYDYNKCTVIDIQPDDPYLSGQKCMAFPAIAPAFKDELCSLGVKEQLNGNTHFVDLSGLYGSTLKVSLALRSENGLLKSTRRAWSKYELPPAQREGKACTDSYGSNKCFAGGDSRLMITLLFTGVQTIFLRTHNQVAQTIFQLQPTWFDDLIYEETKRLVIAYFQRIVYKEYLPILFGPTAYQQYFGSTDPAAVTTYNASLPPIVYNEVATAGFRCHNLIRDLFTRCTTDAKRIDQLWLDDISHKAKYAYDIKNNGLDSLLCGSFYDYGFAADKNFAFQAHNRLFETINSNGYTWRNDLIAINICRGREHGVPSYNTFRAYCNLTKAYYFEDFADTINYDGIQLLQKYYKDVEDVDLFVGINLEDPMKGALLSPTAACLVGPQFQALRDGDRLFYSHAGVLPAPYFNAVSTYPFFCFLCQSVDIDEIPLQPFLPPSATNPLQNCSSCASFTATALGELTTGAG